MKVSVLQENLARALDSARWFTSRGSYLPVCRMVRLTAEGVSLKVEATDLEKSFTTQVGAVIEDEGGICVNASKLREFIGTLGGERVDLEVYVAEDGHPVLSIQTGDRTDASMTGITTEEFPPTTVIENAVGVSMDPDVFGTAIRRVIHAVAKEDTRPILSGALLRLMPSGYEMCGADGFRLAIQKGSLVVAPEDGMDVIIPGKSLEAVAALLKGQEEPILIEVAETQHLIRLHIGQNEVQMQTLVGTFPNYERLIPETEWSVQTQASTLRNAVNSAKVYSESTGILRFWVEPGEGPVTQATEGEEGGEPVVLFPALTKVSATTADIGDAMREAPCQDSHGLDREEPVKIAFQARYITDLLRLTEGSIQMSGTTPSSPGLWSFPDDDSYTLVVMPMFVQW